MVTVLLQIHLLESEIPEMLHTPDSASLLYQAYEKRIFKKLQTDSATYYQSYQYYLNNLEDFEKIYARVVDSLIYREATRNLGKAMDTTKKKYTSPPIPLIDSTLLEHKKMKILKNRGLNIENKSI